ncbi:hypothetical protein [Pseudonocardia sp. Ae505_Ps2]|uniref:hypothetical protein n=1 Tax=Pseudonocardia sp. Ae505_Ps2 TaxID=1885034 RepID=UPI00094EE27A|nr:hypothetical protein [Pseudonocardia sp. Ae505_Ps2]
MRDRSNQFADCVAVLEEEQVVALHAYWDQVLDEAWGVSAPVVADGGERATGVVLALGSRTSVRSDVVNGEAA